MKEKWNRECRTMFQRTHIRKSSSSFWLKWGSGGIKCEREEPGGPQPQMVTAAQHLGRARWGRGELEVETKHRDDDSSRVFCSWKRGEAGERQGEGGAADFEE